MTNVSSNTINSNVIPLVHYKKVEKVELRCNNCNKLLAKAESWKNFGIEIKCPRCASLERF
jgi:Zn finger protein HypA/HybF involved in hydrogenase expression